ncbi:MAG: sugar nucleotide-binding protein, partial [Victivallales bacterium]|nr:sugar nucleotide-binding protein [Victivallales bacterium]
MRLFVTGGKGMLGRTLRRVLTDVEIVVGDLPECDITDENTVREAIAAADVDAVVHCAAMTQVDLCETERERAFLINETGSANVAM